MTNQEGKDNGFDRNTSDAAGKIARYLQSAIEQNLVAALECYLGRVPSNDEVERHARRLRHPGHEEWGWDFLWDNTTLVEVRFHAAIAEGGARWTITRKFGDDQT